MIALPTYNAERDIVAAIRSALAQGVDVHVFDNASSDETAQQAAQLLPESRIHVRSANGGAIANFQGAFDGTDSPFFLWLGHDDRLSPGAVDAMVAALQLHPAAAAALPTVHFVGPTGQVVREQAPLDGLTASSPYKRLSTFVNQVYWVEIYALFRRSCLAAVMPLPEAFGFDVITTWRLLLRYPFCAAPDAVLRYQQADGKTVQQTTAILTPPNRPLSVRRHNVQLWRSLWQATRDPDLTPRIRRAGRAALLTLLLGSSMRIRIRRRLARYARKARR